MTDREGQWYFDEARRQRCCLLERVSAWGQDACRVWYPEAQAVLLVAAGKLRPINCHQVSEMEIRYVCTACRVAGALQENLLLAPIESPVIPLPHQILALSKAVSSERVRLLLADEVGLGKTIEAGLIIKELKLRGLVRRVLVVAPKGLGTQWVAEMRTHFGEEFRLLIPSDFAAFRRVTQQDNVWKAFDQVITSMDSVKPVEGRRGWSREQLAEYNRDRFDDLLAADWDLIVIDESHRLGGSTDQVARYKLGKGLAEAAPYLLLLSATPHQGKSDAFFRLVSLLDRHAFPDEGSVSRDRVEPYVVRTEKRRAIDANGQPLFKPRRTQLVPVEWNSRHAGQQQLYEAVTEYVRLGYNQALREKKAYLGFLLLLMQRLVTSSTRAIRTTLERRLEAIEQPEEQLSLFPLGIEEEWADLDAQEQVESLLKFRIKALKNERAEVQTLLSAARAVEAHGADAKAEALLDWIYRLQQEEGDPDLKVLVFTEFIPTQQMLSDFLGERGFTVCCLNGQMDMDQRTKVLVEFANEIRILVSTDAGGEGLNLQFCHVVVNYDIPWNPMRLEQRIGRVDRIGQSHPVRALNLVLEDTVEYRVREVLEAKLAIILEEYGVDKTGDVLDSAQAAEIFDELYKDAILSPEEVDARVASVLEKVRSQAETLRQGAGILSQYGDLSPAEAQRLLGHPLPHWIERMTVNYLRATGGSAERTEKGWRLRWLDETGVDEAVFSLQEAERLPAASHLTLEHPRIRGLTTQIPRFVEDQPVPLVRLNRLTSEVRGLWCASSVTLRGTDWNRERIFVLFLHEDGRVLLPTARHIWDLLLEDGEFAVSYLNEDQSRDAYRSAAEAAESHGQPIYEELLQFHRSRLLREEENRSFGFDARRRSVGRIGLQAVREHRLKLLVDEEARWRREHQLRATAQPELVLRLILRVEGGAVRA